MNTLEFKKLIREEVRKALKEEAGTQLMSDPAVKSKVEMVIKTLLSIGADGETMQYILEKVGKKWEKQFTGHSGGGNM